MMILPIVWIALVCTGVKIWSAKSISILEMVMVSTPIGCAILTLT